MTYIHAVGTYNDIPEETQPDLKVELKRLSGKVYRRIDHFIQLAVIGAHKSVEGVALPERTAIYMTSGQGNISVFERVRVQRHMLHLLPKPVDFINLLSNSAGFYVATHLGLSGKNLFLAHHRFPVQMTLLAAMNDLKLGKQEAVLVGGVDEWIERQPLARKLLGVSPETALGEGSNWMLLSGAEEGAVGRLELRNELLDLEGLKTALRDFEPGSRVAFSPRFEENVISELLAANPGLSRYGYEAECAYYETLPLYALNRFLETEEGVLFHLDISDGRCRIMRVDNRGFGRREGAI